MDKEKDIEKIKNLLQIAIDKSAKYFQEELKKAFSNGAKHLSRCECEKSLYDFQAEELYNAGYGNIEQAVREFAEKAKQFVVFYKLENKKLAKEKDLAQLINDILQQVENHIDELIDKLIKERFGEVKK